MEQTQIQRTKLHTIYNALDTNNYNRAIKLCTQHKSISNLPITQALKAHAYERIYKKKESLSILQQLLLPFYKSVEEFRVECVDLYLALDEFSDLDDNSIDLIDIFDDRKDDILKKNDVKEQKQHVIIDETTLSTIAITLRSYRLYKTLVSMYTISVSQTPPKHEYYPILLQQLFFSQLRHSFYYHYYTSDTSFDSMQTTSMQLVRTGMDQERYFIWAAICAQLQLAYQDVDKKKDLLLRLAEGFTKKVVLGGNSSNEDWKLYLSFLTQQDKYKDAITTIQTQIKSTPNTTVLQLTDREKLELIASYSSTIAQNLSQDDEYKELSYTNYKLLLKESNYNNFNHGKELLKCSYINQGLDGLVTCRKDILLPNTLIDICIDDQTKNRSLKEKRCVYILLLEYYNILFELHYYKQSKENEIAVYNNSIQLKYIKKFRKEIEQYLTLYSPLVSCCYTDIKPYITMLLKHGTKEIVEELITFCNDMKKDILEKIKDEDIKNEYVLSFSTICYILFYIYLDYKYFEDGIDLNILDELYTVYEWSLSDVNDDKDSTFDHKEVLPSDDLVILMVILLFSQHEKEITNNTQPFIKGVSSYLIEATMLLEYSLQQQQSPNNPILKVYLIQCYKQLGVAKRTIEIYTSLDIKQIQYDSLSYIILPILINTGYYKEVCHNYTSRTILNLHRCSSSRDVPEFIEKCFDRDKINTTQILDMINFQLKYMMNSLQLWVCKGIVLDFAPLCGRNYGDYGLVGTISLFESKSNKTTTNEENTINDTIVAEKMVREMNDHYGAPSLLQSIEKEQSDYDYYMDKLSDNRQYLHDYLKKYYTTKELLVQHTLSRQYIHSILIRVVLLPPCISMKPTRSKNKKNNKPQQSMLLIKRTQSLKTALEKIKMNEKDIFNENDLLWNVIHDLCLVIINIIFSNIAGDNGEENGYDNKILSLIEALTSKIQTSLENFKQSSLKCEYVPPSILKYICNTVPSRIIPIIAILETFGSILHCLGYISIQKPVSKKKKVKVMMKEEYYNSFLSVRKGIHSILDKFHVILCNIALANETNIINHYTKEGESINSSLFKGTTNSKLKTKIIDVKFNYVVRNMLESQSLSKEKLVPFIEQMMDKLDSYD